MQLDDWVLCRIYKKDDKFKKAPRQNHSNVENYASEENSPVRDPNGQLPATSASELPTPVTSNIHRNVMGSHLPFPRTSANLFQFSDTSISNNFLFTTSLALDNPQPLSYGYDLPPFPNQQYNFESYEPDEFRDISVDSLDDFPNFRQTYEYVSPNNFQSDSIVLQNAQTNTPQSMSSSPGGHSST